MNDLTTTLPYAVKLAALSAMAFAVLKVALVANTLGLTAAILFSGFHLPLCAFSALFVWWMYDVHQATGFLALVSTLLNALLV